MPEAKKKYMVQWTDKIQPFVEVELLGGRGKTKRYNHRHVGTQNWVTVWGAYLRECTETERLQAIVLDKV